MSVHSLTRFEPGAAPLRSVLRAALRLRRRLETQPGFEGLQLFQAEAEPGAFLALTQWEAWESHDRAWASPEITAALREAQEGDRLRSQAPNRLDPLFHIHFPKRARTYSMGRLLRADGEQIAAVRAIEKEFGLKVMAAPGSVGVYAGQCVEDPALFFCRIDFDSEEAMAHVRFTSVRAAWQEKLAPCLEWERGWQKLIRFEATRPRDVESGPEMEPGERCAETAGSLSLEMEVQPQERSATLRLRGRMDEAATRRFEKVRDALIGSGCRKLVLDMSGLGYIASAGLKSLLATAKALKAVGGQLTVIDNEGRFNRIVRLLHLEQMLAVRRLRENSRGNRPRRLS
jgi:anti-anti-sigma factor